MQPELRTPRLDRGKKVWALGAGFLTQGPTAWKTLTQAQQVLETMEGEQWARNPRESKENTAEVPLQPSGPPMWQCSRGTLAAIRASDATVWVVAWFRSVSRHCMLAHRHHGDKSLLCFRDGLHFVACSPSLLDIEAFLFVVTSLTLTQFLVSITYWLWGLDTLFKASLPNL